VISGWSDPSFVSPGEEVSWLLGSVSLWARLAGAFIFRPMGALFEWVGYPFFPTLLTTEVLLPFPSALAAVRGGDAFSQRILPPDVWQVDAVPRLPGHNFPGIPAK